MFLIQSKVVFTTSLPWRTPPCVCRGRQIYNDLVWRWDSEMEERRVVSTNITNMWPTWGWNDEFQGVSGWRTCFQVRHLSPWAWNLLKMQVGWQDLTSRPTDRIPGFPQLGPRQCGICLKKCWGMLRYWSYPKKSQPLSWGFWSYLAHNSGQAGGAVYNSKWYNRGPPS